MHELDYELQLSRFCPMRLFSLSKETVKKLRDGKRFESNFFILVGFALNYSFLECKQHVCKMATTWCQDKNSMLSKWKQHYVEMKTNVHKVTTTNIVGSFITTDGVNIVVFLQDVFPLCNCLKLEVTELNTASFHLNLILLISFSNMNEPNSTNLPTVDCGCNIELFEHILKLKLL